MKPQEKTEILTQVHKSGRYTTNVGDSGEARYNAICGKSWTILIYAHYTTFIIPTVYGKCNK